MRNLRSLTFEGDAPPQSIDTNAFNGIAGTGDIFYPFGAGGSYTEAWRDSIGLLGWRLQVRPITGDGYSFARTPARSLFPAMPARQIGGTTPASKKTKCFPSSCGTA